jgi:TonB family protein
VSATHIKVCDSETFLNCHEVEGVDPPKLRHSEEPKWPSEARRQHIGGVAVVRLIVDEKGMPRNVRIVRSTAVGLTSAQLDVGVEMDESAVNAVKKFRFNPAMLKGQAVPVEVTVMQNFHVY